jgi:hypothetical protein
VKKRQDVVVEQLKNKEKLSEAEETWLDNDANHVEEDALIARYFGPC